MTDVSPSPDTTRTGFTLVEMAVVVTIMGLVMLMVFPALTALRQANERTVTQTNLQTLMTATATFVQAHGCLPCPALPGETLSAFGTMGYASTSTVCGVCSAPQGIPPFAALGIPPATARDGWGRWITMRVDAALTNPTAVFVPPTTPCTTSDVANGLYGCTTVGASVKGLCTGKTASSGSALSGITIKTMGNGATQYAAVVFISHGADGYGSYVASPRKSGFLLPFPSGYAACASAIGFAQCNSAARNGTAFIDAPSYTNAMDTFDDVLVYASRNALVSRLSTGACHSDW